MKRYPCLAVVLCTLAFSASARAARVEDAGHGFSFVLPDGYAEFPQGRRMANAIQSFARGRSGQGPRDVLIVESMAGTIGRGPIDRAAVERAARASAPGVGIQFDYGKVKWRSFDLDLVIGRASTGVVTLETQVPLAHQAIQVLLAGPAADEAALTSDLHGVLASLDGESSWLTDSQRSERLGFACGLGLASLLAGAVVLLLRRRRARRVA